MKIKTTVATLSILSVLSFGAFAADAINAEQAQSRESIGTVSVGAIGTSPMDMNQMLKEKAQEQGASSYRVIEARTGDHWHATAELYK
ncbi:MULTISPECIES: peroxide/acid stress response protein YhcN [Leclercia]|uniref:peroxide/acid stress response protein YhcN n=1 Tax=Leclercia TaxID=83654 RepID=UPI00321A8466